MTARGDRLLERALAATRESRRVAFRKTFDVHDVLAMANSGGGVILFDPDAEIEPAPMEVELEIRRLPHRVALIVEEAPTPVVENGIVWVRHGAKTAPATTADLDDMLKRRIKRTITSALRPRQPVLPREVRDSESPAATPIRVVTDPRAPAFRVVDYDRTHPFRQKELLAALHSRLPGLSINQFDLQAVRHILNTDANPDFTHKPVFGTRQYSAKYIDWLVEQAEKDPTFFARAKEEYIRSRKR